MGPILALIIIVVVSLIIVRVSSTALMMTGLSWDTASFQAYSAFFGVGFTTSEAELVVNHPVRRRIIRDLILAGNVGLTSALATIIITFLQKSTSAAVLTTLGILAAFLVSIFILSKVGLIQRALDSSIRRALKRFGMVHVMDYELILRVRDGFCISEIDIVDTHPWVGKELGESRPADQGIIVLGINKADGTFLGTPNRHHFIEPGDTLLAYGNKRSLRTIRSKKNTPTPPSSSS